MLRRLLSVPNGDRKRAARRILLPLGPALVVLIGGYIYVTGGRYVSTENAYVKADLVAVSAEISGPISEIGPDDNMPVTRGEMLFAIDPRPFEIARNRTRARLDLVRDEIEGLKSLYGQKTQELAMAQTDLEFAEREFGRQSALASNGFASRSKLDEVHTGLETARQRIGALILERQQILNRLSGDAEIAVEIKRTIATTNTTVMTVPRITHFRRRTLRSNSCRSTSPTGSKAARGSSSIILGRRSDDWRT